MLSKREAHGDHELPFFESEQSTVGSCLDPDQVVACHGLWLGKSHHAEKGGGDVCQAPFRKQLLAFETIVDDHDFHRVKGMGGVGPVG